MILHEFPNLQWLKSQAESRFRDRRGVGGIVLDDPGWPSVILNTRVRSTVRDNIRGPLSIFTNLSGTSYVTVDKKRAAVTPQTFFISNSQQHYTLEIDKKPAETFNIHFGENFIEKALAGILQREDQLLLNEPNGVRDFGFYNKIVPASGGFQRIIASIQQEGSDRLYLDEKLFDLLSLLLNEQNSVKAMRERLPSLKASTKGEIMKRMVNATDYIYTYYDKNPSLDELAAVSCLSKFHFLRLFKIAYHQTPRQFITTLRIERAKTLLQKTVADVRSIGAEVGFKDSSSFSRAFYNQVGVYPSQFRGKI
ncbi:MAG TPA: AraC family transcriptional regulator [Cyclobacteriaceae bacterium]|nr:AraC family transcriptional regulator [Cyclobacteriaceae bacterium]